MKTAQDLKQHLLSINKRSYPAYKDTKGSYRFGSYILNIDHVQGDPFASPSRISVLVPGAKAGFPASLFDLPHKRIALEDHLIRLFAKALEQYQFKARGSGKSGLMSISRPGQEILKRTACTISPDDGSITMSLAVGFPANGRTINSGELIRILFDFLPACVEKTLFYASLNDSAVRSVVDLAEDQQYIREQLKERGLTAFVANGSILPRGKRRLLPAYEKSRTLSLPRFHGSHPCPPPPRSHHRHGDQKGHHPDHRRRIPRKIHAVKSAGTGRIQPYQRGWAGIRHHRRHRHEDPRRGRTLYPQHGYLAFHQQSARRPGYPQLLHRRRQRQHLPGSQRGGSHRSRNLAAADR